MLYRIIYKSLVIYHCLKHVFVSYFISCCKLKWRLGQVIVCKCVMCFQKLYSLSVQDSFWEIPNQDLTALEGRRFISPLPAHIGYSHKLTPELKFTWPDQGSNPVSKDSESNAVRDAERARHYLNILYEVKISVENSTSTKRPFVKELCYEYAYQLPHTWYVTNYILQ